MEPGAPYILRPVGADDDAFLFQLFVAQHDATLPQSLSMEERRQLLVLQFAARNTSYAAKYPCANNDLICTPERSRVGRILVAQNAEGVHVIDIAILPERQQGGIGTHILRALQRSCAQQGKAITLQVQRDSPARSLYRRLGFQTEGEQAVYAQLAWRE